MIGLPPVQSQKSLYSHALCVAALILGLVLASAEAATRLQANRYTEIEFRVLGHRAEEFVFTVPDNSVATLRVTELGCPGDSFLITSGREVLFRTSAVPSRLFCRKPYNIASASVAFGDPSYSKGSVKLAAGDYKVRVTPFSLTSRHAAIGFFINTTTNVETTATTATLSASESITSEIETTTVAPQTTTSSAPEWTTEPGTATASEVTTFSEPEPTSVQTTTVEPGTSTTETATVETTLTSEPESTTSETASTPSIDPETSTAVASETSAVGTPSTSDQVTETTATEVPTSTDVTTSSALTSAEPTETAPPSSTLSVDPETSTAVASETSAVGTPSTSAQVTETTASEVPTSTDVTTSSAPTTAEPTETAPPSTTTQEATSTTSVPTPIAICHGRSRYLRIVTDPSYLFKDAEEGCGVNYRMARISTLKEIKDASNVLLACGIERAWIKVESANTIHRPKCFAIDQDRFYEPDNCEQEVMQVLCSTP